MANLESYTKTTWENGQVITAAPLNKIEKAIDDVTNAVLGMATTISSNDLKATKITVREIAGVSSNDSTAANITIGENTTLNFQGPVQANGKISLNYKISKNTDAASKKYVDDAISGYDVKSISASNGIAANTTDGVTNISLQAATADTLGGIKVGNNLTIDNDGKLNATDTTYSEATESAAGLMSAADKVKLNGAVTGVKINDSTKNPSNGVVDLGNLVTGIMINNASASIDNGIVDLGTVIRDVSSKADLANPSFTGTATFEKIKIGNYELDETKLSQLLALLENNGGE